MVFREYPKLRELDPVSKTHHDEFVTHANNAQLHKKTLNSYLIISYLANDVEKF